jgi:hypothetical protein
MIAAIDTEALVELVWAAPLAAITVAITFALFIHGASRATDLRRSGGSARSTAYGVLAVLAGLAFTGTVAAGVAVIVAG